MPTDAPFPPIPFTPPKAVFKDMSKNAPAATAHVPLPSSAAAAANAIVMDPEVNSAAIDDKAPSGSAEKPVLPTFSLDGRTVVITGGAGGLGLVMAKGLVLSGAGVALVDLNDTEAASQISVLEAAFKDAHPTLSSVPRVTAHKVDVSSEESVAACIGAVVSVHGKIDGLVTSAGFTETIQSIDYPIDRMRKLWAVNVDGTYIFAQQIARHLVKEKRGGSMVFIGSMSGSIVNVPQPQAPYNASKAAVRHLCASMAVEWAPHQIRVNTISPGYMLTALTEKILEANPDLRDAWVGGTPQGRMGAPEDLMGPVTFLLSDASRFVTGADLRVDGGYTVM
ncbi:hypothetical protein MKZ38_004760 [Zalerion maritima]|uniref:Uncharacterized protein n=1 Tax=Zalerion maritima TaxID=339359 RepID=A0AAD5RYD7_9PEZI|nr:hypothetical protein MKZ38_004760 [Zalerion maritima]